MRSSACSGRPLPARRPTSAAITASAFTQERDGAENFTDRRAGTHLRPSLVIALCVRVDQDAEGTVNHAAARLVGARLPARLSV